MTKFESSLDLQSYQSRRAAWLVERELELPGDTPALESFRNTLRRQFMRSLGLDPLPPRGDPGARELGSFSGQGFTATKLAYQLLPDCWGSAHYYRPSGTSPETRLPAVLYACGHSDPGVVHFRNHAMGWARRGYACLVFNTLQQHGNPGEHQALNLGRTPEWIGLGYSAAGGEVFNGLRALDLLMAQPGVDLGRIGVTGISGGGSQSFFLAIAEPRLAAVATVAGVSDAAHAIPNGHLEQHCDCIYLRNNFGHDIALYASLIAPRALLFCFARHDILFTPEEFRGLHQRTRRYFEQLGCGEKCALWEYDGPHGYNHRSTTDTIHEWFDRHVAGAGHPPVDTLAQEAMDDGLDENALGVFHGKTPSPNVLHLLPELLSPRGQVELPRTPGDWPRIKNEVLTLLNNDVFPLLDAVEKPQTLEQTGDWLLAGRNARRRRWSGMLDGMRQVIMEIAPLDGNHDSAVLTVGGRDVEALNLTGAAWGASGKNAAVVGIQPRGCGLNAFPESKRNHFNREGCLTGMTPTMMMVQDLCCLWPLLADFPSVQSRKVILHGRGEGALAVLYFALLRPPPGIVAVLLEDLPNSHTETGFQLMGILRVLNLPHAVGLLAPLPVVLINPGGNNFHWSYAVRAHARGGHLEFTNSLAEGFSKFLS